MCMAVCACVCEAYITMPVCEPIFVFVLDPDSSGSVVRKMHPITCAQAF